VSVYCIGTGYLEFPVTDGSVAPIPPPYDATELADPELPFAGVPGTTLWNGAAPGSIEGFDADQRAVTGRAADGNELERGASDPERGGRVVPVRADQREAVRSAVMAFVMASMS